jgi:hypothetical protein
MASPLIPGAEPIARAPRYRLYLDESGDHNYTDSEDVGMKYLALLGVWFRQAPDYTTFAENLDLLKDAVFGKRPDKPVVLHRADIIRKNGPFGILNDPKKREEFNSGLLDLIKETNFKIVCALLNKKAHKAQYAHPFHPYHFCLAAILDRYCGWLNFKGGVGDVMAESRGKLEDTHLKQAHRSVYETGTLMFGSEMHQRALTSKEIKMELKRSNIAGLQLADVLAHPVKQMALNSKGVCLERISDFGKAIWNAALPKLNRNETTGVVEGYGIIWLRK